MVDQDKAIAAAVALFKAGDARASFQALGAILRHPCALDDAQFSAAVEHWARAAGKMKHVPFVTELKALAVRPSDARMQFELGAVLMEEELPSLAATFLTRSHAKRKIHEETVSELVCALEGMDRHDEALAVLSALDDELLEGSFACAFLLGFHELLAGDVEAAREAVTPLLEERDPELHALAVQLDEMVSRATALKGATSLDTKDLQGWHCVLNGGFLVQPAAVDALTLPQVHACLLAARDILKLAGIKPPQVVFAPDAPSRALGQAMASILGVPCVELPATGTVLPCLYVVHDVGALDHTVAALLQWHRDSQPLFALTAHRAVEPPFVADITGYLRETEGTAPTWDAANILSAVPGPVPDVAPLVKAVLSVTGSAGVGLGLASGERRRQRVESPVPRLGVQE